MKLQTHISRKGNNAMITGALIGVGIAIAISLLLSMGLASLVLKGTASMDEPGIYVFLIRALSVFMGSFLATVIVKEKHLQVIGIVAAGYLLVLLAGGIIFYDGSFHNFGTGMLSSLVGGAISCLIKVIPRKKGYRLPKISK